MTLEEIQSDESRRLAEFPVAENTIYLAHILLILSRVAFIPFLP